MPSLIWKFGETTCNFPTFRHVGHVGGTKEEEEEEEEEEKEEEVETCLTSLSLTMNTHEAEVIGYYRSDCVHLMKLTIAFVSKNTSDEYKNDTVRNFNNPSIQHWTLSSRIYFDIRNEGAETWI